MKSSDKRSQKASAKGNYPPIQESQFRTLIETALDLIGVLNYDGAIRYLSPSSERVIGYAPNELTGENAFAHMHPDDSPAQMEAFNRLVSDPELATAGEPHYFRFRHKDGQWIVLEAISSKLPAGPEPSGVVVNARNVTERVQAREYLREAAEVERRTAQEIEVIAEVGRIISSTLNIEEVFELFADQLRRLFEFDMVFATIVDHAQQTTTIRYWSGPADYLENFVTTVPLKGSITGEVLAGRQPVLIQGTSEEKFRQNYIHIYKGHQNGVISWLGVPMVNRGVIIGALVLVSSKPMAFSDLDITLAVRVSNQIAGAIDNAGLFAGLKEAEAGLAKSVVEQSVLASQNEVIAEIGRIISSTLDIDGTDDSLVEQARQLLDFDVLSIEIHDAERKANTILYWSGLQVPGREIGTRVFPKGSLTDLVKKTLTPQIIQGLTGEELAEQFPFVVDGYKSGMRSWLACPMVNRGEFVGPIIFHSRRKNAFSQQDANMAWRVSNQVSGSIDGSRLHADLKKAEADLAAVIDRNKMILETAHDAFISIDDRGQVVAWNSEAEKIFGWTVEEAVRRRLADLIIPARFARQHLEGIANFLATGEGSVSNQRLELVAKRRDGQEFPVELTISPLKIGDSYLFNAFIRDITIQREAEDALRRSEERFRAVYNNAAHGIGTRTMDGVITDLNPAFLDMVGYTIEEIRDLEPGVLYDTRYLEYEKGLWDAALHGEEIPRYEKEYIHKDGTTIYAEVRASLDRDDEGNPVGIVAVVTDVTERNRLAEDIAQYTANLELVNEELQQLDLMKDDFISTVSHELRTPLTSIKGSAELLLNYADHDRDAQMEFLRIINNESDRLTRLITDVLDLSRMESRQMSWIWEDFGLLEVVNSAVDSVHSLRMQKDLSININLHPSLPRLWNDRDRLVQVVTNLLSNSIKFTPEGGEVWISAKKVAPDPSDGLGDKLEVCVADTGIGIHRSEHENIFRKFAQVGGLSEKPGGTGLGLPICKEIVEFFGGKIWVDSTLGQGSSFYFTVPVTAVDRVSDGDPNNTGQA